MPVSGSKELSVGEMAVIAVQNKQMFKKKYLQGERRKIGKGIVRIG